MGAREAEPPPEPPAGHRLVGVPPEEASTGPEGSIPPVAADADSVAPAAVLGPRPEPLARLGNYATVGVCAIVAYWALFLVVALVAVASGSIEGVVILNLLYLLFFLVLILAGIPFISWFYRAYRNLPLLDAKPRFSPSMAIACWLIPFANWVLPGMIGDEIWRAGRPSGRPPRGDGSNLARVWWGVNVAVSLTVIPLLVALSFLFGRGGEAFALWTLLASAMVAVSAGLAIAFVRRASERLDALAGHAPPGGDLERAIASIYETLPVPDSLTEESVGAQPAGRAPVSTAPQAAAAPQPDATTFCTRCGAPEEAGASFCGACGASLR